MTQDDKTMLALAALAYRGFGNRSEKAIDDALRPWLPKLEAEGLGRWEVVWGPASFHTPTSLVDDAMMYVARQLDRPSGSPPRYAIAIRGTNPVSLFDWIFGDFWVQLQIEWNAADDPSAKTSASTALGLAIIQHMAAEVPPTAGGRLASFGNAVVRVFQKFARDLPEHEPGRLWKDPSSLSDSKRMTEVAGLANGTDKKLRSRAVDELLKHFEGPVARVRRAMEQRVFDAFLRQIEAARDNGTTLLAFLNSVEQNAVVAVTGHSKGGALSAATALWLAETCATERQVEIQCFSFAGPTAGNVSFARRYNARLASRTRRIVNPRDIVPQAFVPEKLQGLIGFYPQLGLAVDLVIQSVANLGYTHVGGELVEIESKSVGSNLVAELIYQHLDAYLKDAAFQDPQWNARSIFIGE